MGIFGKSKGSKGRRREGDGERLTTIPHETYVTPTSDKLMEVASEQEIKGKFGANLTKDMANMFSHHEASQSQFGYYTTGSSKFNPEDALIPYDQLKGTPEEKAKQQQVQDFLKKIPYSRYKGSSPAHKAMRCLNHVSSAFGRGGNGGGDGSGTPAPDWMNELIQQSSPNKIVEELEATLDAIDKLTPFQKECLDTEDLDNLDFSEDLFMQLEILSRLMNMDAIKTQGSIVKIKDNRGKHRVNMRMASISDVARVKKVNMMLPNFNIKLAQKEFYISEKIRREGKKQILFYLEDDSSSMRKPFKTAFCNAVAMNRCEAVADGHAELIFYSYERGMYNRHHITNKEEALEFYHTHKNRSRDMGGTDIGGCVTKAIDEILTFDGIKPEIMIVCDGQDKVNPTNTRGVKVHSFIIGQQNEGLKNLCVGSGGIYMYEDMNRGKNREE